MPRLKSWWRWQKLPDATEEFTPVTSAAKARSSYRQSMKRLRLEKRADCPSRFFISQLLLHLAGGPLWGGPEKKSNKLDQVVSMLPLTCIFTRRAGQVWKL